RKVDPMTHSRGARSNAASGRGVSERKRGGSWGHAPLPRLESTTTGKVPRRSTRGGLMRHLWVQLLLGWCVVSALVSPLLAKMLSLGSEPTVEDDMSRRRATS